MKSEKDLDRKKFLGMIGMSASALVMFGCMGCSKSSGGGSAIPPSNVNFTLDLTSPANSALTKNGGYLVTNGVIVARTNTGSYIAVQQSCTHENYPLAYQPANFRFYCNNHGATFSEKGVVTGGPTNRSLTVYNTQLTSTSLNVFS